MKDASSSPVGPLLTEDAQQLQLAQPVGILLYRTVLVRLCILYISRYSLPLYGTVPSPYGVATAYEYCTVQYSTVSLATGGTALVAAAIDSSTVHSYSTVR